MAGVFDLSPDKILILGILALVVLGPNRLPEAARTAGRLLGQLRRMSAGFQSEVREALAEPAEALSSVVTELRPPDVRRSVRQAVTSTFISDPSPAGSSVPSIPAASGPQGAASLVPPAPDDPSLN